MIAKYEELARLKQMRERPGSSDVAQVSQLKSKVINILEEASLKCVKQGLSKQDPFHTYKNEVQKYNKDFDKMTEEERDQIYRDNWEKLS